MKGAKEMRLHQGLYQLCTVTGLAGSVVAHLFGAYDMIIEGLVALMCLDYISGCIVAVMNKSPKTENGGLSSKIGFKGLCKKCLILLCIIAAHYIDMILGVDYIRNAVAIGFITNEFISFVENLGAGGLQMPQAVMNTIEILKSKSEEEGE